MKIIDRGIMAVDGELHSDEEALLPEQGSESKGNPDYSRWALERGLELLDLTIADPKHRHRLRELSRLREARLDYFPGENQFGSTERSWRSYFHAYGLAAAIRREATW